MLTNGHTETDVPSTRSLVSPARAVAHVALLGAVLGGGSGLLEAVLMITVNGRLMTRADVFGMTLFYAVFWGIVGLAVGTILWAVLRLGGVDDASAKTSGVGGRFLLALVLLVMVGAYVNVWHMPAMLSRPSLLFDLALFAACVLLYIILRRRSRIPSGLRLRSSVSIAAAVLAVILLVLVLVPERRHAGDEVTSTPTRDVNVLFLVVDALRPGHLGVYGYDRPTSPTIDRLARDGLRFVNAYAQAPCTNESTATMVTSLYPSTHSVTGTGDALPDSCLTLMEAMRRSGYRSAILSANPYVSPLTGFGEDVSFFYSETVPYTRACVLRVALNHLRALGRAASWVPEAVGRLERLIPLPRGVASYQGGDAGVMNAVLLDWIDREPDSSFFAYVHYMEPHEPYDPPEPYDEMYDPGFEGRKWFFPPQRMTPDGLRSPEPDPLPEDERRNMVARYDGEIAYFDMCFAGLLDGLSERGFLENTLIVMTADHGEEFFDHGRWGHSHSLYEELVRVPLILWWPDVIEGGRIEEWAVRHVDIMPTILGAVGCSELLDGIYLEGRNLWAEIESGVTPTVPLPGYSELCVGTGFSRSLRQGNMKVIVSVEGTGPPVMLFDLAADPGETMNLAPEHPGLASSLGAQVNTIFDRSHFHRLESRRFGVDPMMKERLRSLGYMQ